MQLYSPPKSTLQMIPDGVAGIRATLAVMARFVKEFKKNMEIRDLAISLISDCAPKDWACEVRCLHAFVRDDIRYTRDVEDVETIQTPIVTLEKRAGDCDDKSTLLAALLGSVGHPSRFVAIGFKPGTFSHVYVETLVGTKWIPLETTEPVEAGWSPNPRAVVERINFHT